MDCRRGSSQSGYLFVGVAYVSLLERVLESHSWWSLGVWFCHPCSGPRILTSKAAISASPIG